LLLKHKCYNSSSVICEGFLSAKKLKLTAIGVALLVLLLGANWVYGEKEFLAWKYFKGKPVYAKVGSFVIYQEELEALKKDAVLAGVDESKVGQRVVGAYLKLNAAKELKIFPKDSEVKEYCSQVYAEPYGFGVDASGKEIPVPASAFVRYDFDTNKWMQLHCRSAKSESDIKSGEESLQKSYAKLLGNTRVRTYQR
jgi:hypothetical protein